MSAGIDRNRGAGDPERSTEEVRRRKLQVGIVVGGLAFVLVVVALIVTVLIVSSGQ
ncbi:hypothetical protein [Cryobacterium sp. MLB-32]|uniref:hypothetical protein n=1 Tax=Cryobacterium sp. MLB-32 TaxID=1529318 RepID=UPI0012E003B7|nr:hypothetical protein [Cryobacterium sp. MLB-32]